MHPTVGTREQVLFITECGAMVHHLSGEGFGDPWQQGVAIWTLGPHDRGSRL